VDSIFVSYEYYPPLAIIMIYAFRYVVVYLSFCIRISFLLRASLVVLVSLNHEFKLLIFYIKEANFDVITY